mmetsp:Transcript_9588/g.14513  ORF Transcript_9588/g.14513 Transcript_9588/m.14513 type:complete len:389 (-) Transcript_9588:226-1392(-)
MISSPMNFVLRAGVFFFIVLFTATYYHRHLLIRKPLDSRDSQHGSDDYEGATFNDRPVVAIVTQPTRENSTGYIAASYVKWLESAGARSIALPYDAPDSYTEKVFANVNGVLFTGGATVSPPKAARRIYALAEAANKKFNALRIKENNGVIFSQERASLESGIPNEFEHVEADFFPIWGTCLGFEWLLQIGAGRDDILEPNFDSSNISLPLIFTNAGLEKTQIFSDEHFRSVTATRPIAMNNHEWGIEPDDFYADPNLASMYTVTTVNNDRVGRPFVSSIEGIAEKLNPRSRPYYAVQWHPEKNNFEYGSAGKDGIAMNGDLPYVAINHSDSAVRLSFETASFFVKKTRLSSHRYKNLVDFPPVWNYPSHSSVTGAFIEYYIVPSVSN